MVSVGMLVYRIHVGFRVYHTAMLCRGQEDLDRLDRSSPRRRFRHACSCLFRSKIWINIRLGQATWITLVSLPAILVNSIPRAAQPVLGLKDLIGLGIWAGGLGLEILADNGELGGSTHAGSAIITGNG